MADTVRLLASLPLARWLAPGGLVAVWLTNKHAILPALTDPPGAGVGGGAGGVFSAWGVELVAEWVWVKVTQAGEPVFDVESAYRKPWERLLVARRRGGGGGGRGGGGESGMAQTPGTEPAQKTAVTPRVIAAVPDVHSRKPNLRALFADVLPQGFTAMEVFARNLTAGWWCWGDDVLRFQGGEWWSEEDAKREAAVDDGTL
jgi:N6-adenosine-specific RNA methylase IME4